MGIINNGEVTNAYTKDLNLQPTVSKVLNTNSDFIQPTYDYSNTLYANVIARATATTGVFTIYTTPTDKDFFCETLNLARSKIVTDTESYTEIRMVVNGGFVYPLSMAGTTLTAEDSNISMTFNPPIKVDKGTTIIVSNTGTYTRMLANVIGYTKQKN